MPEAVIVSTARSPIGRAFKGSLASLRADDMAAQMVTAALAKVPELPIGEVEDLMLGCGLPGAEQGFNMGRVVSLLAGIDSVPGTTVTRYCASSLQTIRMAAHAVRAGEGDAFIAAGVEAVSHFFNGSSDHVPNTQNPRFADAASRSAARASGAAATWSAPEGLPDIYIEMGQTAENVVQITGVSREAMDEYAARSQNRAVDAIDRGFFERDITPITLADGTVVSADDGPRRGTTVEKLSTLQPAFRPDGSVTAGNACPLNDGAAAVVVMSDTRAKELGIRPLARIIASSVSALNPEIMGLGPIEAVKKVLARAGMSIGDVDLVEINEAFAAQVIPSAQELGIDFDKLNVNGGAIALGHPFGMTGARIMSTLINGLADADKTIGLETMCVGGGQGMAMLIERLS